MLKDPQPGGGGEVKETAVSSCAQDDEDSVRNKPLSPSLECQATMLRRWRSVVNRPLPGTESQVVGMIGCAAVTSPRRANVPT